MLHQVTLKEKIGLMVIEIFYGYYRELEKYRKLKLENKNSMAQRQALMT